MGRYVKNVNKCYKMIQNSFGRRFFYTCIASYKSHDSLPLYHTSNANFYTVLEIKKDASLSQVKNAYFEKSKELHPDKNDTEEAKRNYKDVREAYDILGDRRKRRAYDKMLFRQDFQENVEKESENYSNFTGGTRWENKGFGNAKFYRRSRVDDLNDEYAEYGRYRQKTRRDHEENYDKARYHKEKEFAWEDVDDSDSKNNKKYYEEDDPRHPDSKEYKDFEEKPLDLHHWSKLMRFTW